MSSYHYSTVHTWESVRSGRGMDWSRQPDVFKEYPQKFPTVSLAELPELRQFLYHSCGLTAHKEYPGGTYSLRANPSAGALYPCELYLQARGVSGLTNGIYHVEPASQNLRLLHSLSEQEGIEGYCSQNRQQEGLVLLVTAIYYRSSWKYGHRAFRYCLLDSGHLLGAIEAAASCAGISCSFHTCFDRQRVQKDFGFKGEELPMAMVFCGDRKEKTTIPPAMQIPYVNGSGFFVEDTVIEKTFQEVQTPSLTQPGLAGDPYAADTDLLSQAIVKRRSIRSFTAQTIESRQYQAVLRAANSGMGIDCDTLLDLFIVVHRVEGMTPGLYLGDTCLRSGNFSTMAGYLCLEQVLGADSAATLFLVSNADHYLPIMLKAGFIGQRIYLAAILQGLGCSGIGAFYDREVADFLDTNGMILYAMAFGR